MVLSGPQGLSGARTGQSRAYPLPDGNSSPQEPTAQLGDMMADNPTLAWKVKELPPALRSLPEEARLVAKAIYNGRLLSDLPGDPVAETLRELKVRHVT